MSSSPPFSSIRLALCAATALLLAAGCAASDDARSSAPPADSRGPLPGQNPSGVSPADPGVPNPNVPPAGGSGSAAPGGNTNVALGGAQDFGYFRRLVTAGQVPKPTDFDAAGFFAEHHTKLPAPTCGKRICLQTMMAVMTSLSSSASCTMLQLGLNSTLVADPNMRPPLNLVISIDVSGSMNTGGKIEFVRAGLEQLIDGLRDTDKLALVTYSDSAQVIFPMADVGLRRAELRALIQGLLANGATALHDGLKTAYGEALKNHDSGRQNRVILLSDGQPTIGITSAPEILTMSRGFNSEGVGLTTIGVGTDFNPVLMRELAQQADGNFYFVENAGAVKEVFGDELSYFTVPIAYDLKLELEAGAFYNFGRAYGSSFWKDGGVTGGALDVPSVFLAHRKSHDDQTPAGGRRGGGSALLVELMPKHTSDDGSGATTAQVARIKISFREPGTNLILTDEVLIDYPSAPWVTPERGFFQSPDIGIVQKSFVMLNMYMAIEQASRDFYTGDRRPIIGRLRHLRAAVADYNEEIADQDIVSDLTLLDQFIAVLRQNGVIDPETQPPANPWPAD